MGVYEHIEGIKKMLKAECNIDGNGQYNDWQALLKFNRDEENGAFAPRDMAYDYVDSTISVYIDKQTLSEVKDLSKVALEEMDNLLSVSEYEYYSNVEEFLWEDGVQKLLHKYLFKSVYNEAGSETYFDEHNHDMCDILNQMSIRIEQLKKMNDEKIKGIVEELDWFRQMLYEYD